MIIDELLIADEFPTIEPVEVISDKTLKEKIGENKNDTKDEY